MFSFRLRSSSAALLIVICGSVHAQSDPAFRARPARADREGFASATLRQGLRRSCAYVRIEPEAQRTTKPAPRGD